MNGTSQAYMQGHVGSNVSESLEMFTNWVTSTGPGGTSNMITFGLIVGFYLAISYVLFVKNRRIRTLRHVNVC